MLNSISMVGRLTRDPENRKTTSGNEVASFTLACDDDFKGPDGEKRTVFISVSAFGKQAEVVAKYTRRGTLVGVTGRLTQRKYTSNKTGQDVTVTEIVAEHINLMEPKPTNPDGASPASGAKASPTPAVVDNGNLDGIEVSDEELPF